ncbi:hypothetical protein [Megamonas funiformis]|uniref:hypothetical protein n=1 Tax=Megamonas funiformis TaxID=437897 RepID=UPI003F864AAD
MKTTLKKKLTAAILAGCSTFILSGVALANPLPKIYKNIKICLFPSSLNPILP